MVHVCMYMHNLVYDNFVTMGTTKQDILTKTVNTNGMFVNSDISLKHINVYGFYIVDEHCKHTHVIITL